MREVKAGEVLSEQLQDGLLSVFVTELSPHFEGQLFVDISQEIIHTRTSELNLSKGRVRQRVLVTVIRDLPSPHIDPSTPSQISEGFHP